MHVRKKSVKFEKKFERNHRKDVREKETKKRVLIITC